MRRLEYFHFCFLNAWMYPGYIAKLDGGEMCKIKFTWGKPIESVKGIKIISETFERVLQDGGNDFIQDLEQCGVPSWNEKYLINRSFLDGWNWELKALYDGKQLQCGGDNAFPKSFGTFMQLLHKKYALPYCWMEKEDTDFSYGDEGMEVKAYAERFKL